MNENIVPYLQKVFSVQIEHVKEMDRQGMSFSNMLNELRDKFTVDYVEAKVILMLVFPNYS
jgi:intein-encoded DNA endonuclease-like protein